MRRDEHFVDHDEFGRMHYGDHSRPGFPVPPWTLDDAKVKDVVLYNLALQARYRKLPSTPDEQAELVRLADVQLAKSGPSRQRLQSTERFGGQLPYLVSLLYRKYRLRMDSFDLAEYYGIQANTIRQQLQRLNRIARQLFPAPENHVPLRKGAKPQVQRPLFLATRRRMSDEQVAEALALHEQGVVFREIAHRLGFHEETVRRRVIATPGYKRRYTVDVRRALEMRDSGMNSKAVAAELGFSADTVRSAVNRHLKRASHAPDVAEVTLSC